MITKGDIKKLGDTEILRSKGFFQKLFLILCFLTSLFFIKFNDAIILSVSTMAVAMFYKAYKKEGKEKPYLFSMLFFSLFYLLGDVSWIYYEMMVGGDVPQVHISTVFFLMNGVMMLLSTYLIIFSKKYKWDSLHNLLNSSIFGICICYIMWKVFFQKFFQEISIKDTETLINIGYIIIDFFMLLGVFQVVNGKKKIMKSWNNKAIFGGVLAWSCLDLYSLYYHIYNPKNVLQIYFIDNCLDLIFPFLMLLIAAAQFSKIKRREKRPEIESGKLNQRIGLLIPFLIGIALILSIGDYRTILFFLGMFVVWRVLLKYIWIYEALEQKVEEINKLNNQLEQKVEERTKALREKNEELYRLANIDTLTNLPNRRNFIKHLDGLIDKNGKGSPFAVAFIDLDKFKEINDFYGHDVGDKFLLETAKRLEKVIENRGYIARQGGDEFVAILTDFTSLEGIKKIAENMLEAFQGTCEIDGKRISSTISMGISLYPYDGKERSDLMKSADLALYKAKTEGKNRVRFYSCGMKREIYALFE